MVAEVHVPSFTAHASSGVAPERRGKFLGVIDKASYLVRAPLFPRSHRRLPSHFQPSFQSERLSFPLRLARSAEEQ